MMTTNEGCTMPIIFKNKDSRIGFQLGQRSAHRSTNELVDQLMDQIRAERAQAAARLAEKQRELTATLHDLAELRYLMAKRYREETFASAPSPSTMIH
jgi:hypothetical protein